jgi:type VI secretion system protein ImpI
LAAPGRPPSVPPGVGAAGGRAATSFLQGLTAEAMALQGLQELAASLVPGVPLDSTGDIARFITKLHDALDAFCRSFIPLREGHAQFMSSLDLQRSRRRSLQRSHAYLAVEGARNPEALAAALLNPKDKSFDAPQAVEGILADLMLHQLAMLEGVMRGVRALLEELSPENIERQMGGGLTLNRHKALWNKYLEIFENVSEERQAFSLIFGPEFTAAYRQYRQTSGESPH